MAIKLLKVLDNKMNIDQQLLPIFLCNYRVQFMSKNWVRAEFLAFFRIETELNKKCIV